MAIIGGSGFIWIHLAKCLLFAGHAVEIIDKNDSYKYPYFRVCVDVGEYEIIWEIF